jgi:hypothetical protein
MGMAARLREESGSPPGPKVALLPGGFVVGKVGHESRVVLRAGRDLSYTVRGLAGAGYFRP